MYRCLGACNSRELYYVRVANWHCKAWGHSKNFWNLKEYSPPSPPPLPHPRSPPPPRLPHPQAGCVAHPDGICHQEGGANLAFLLFFVCVQMPHASGVDQDALIQQLSQAINSTFSPIGVSDCIVWQARTPKHGWSLNVSLSPFSSYSPPELLLNVLLTSLLALPQQRQCACTSVTLSGRGVQLSSFWGALLILQYSVLQLPWWQNTPYFLTVL